MDSKPPLKVNLIKQGLNTCISSPQLSSDGYSITNLLSDTNAGFLVEHFMKPPVYIDIEFMCNMYIQEIVINTRLGTQKSKGIELLIDDQTVGKCYLESNQDIVHWVRNTRSHASTQCPNKNISVCEFYSGAHRHLSSTKKITVKIFKTENSSLVAIKSLKIFGSVNKRTNEHQVTDKFLQLIQQVYTKPVSSFNFQNRERENITESKQSPESLEEIPDDFLDPITHEFMTNPIILPCGKIIDKTTLDKYVENELKWNRLPNDPFTNVKFNNHQKPVQALQLKSRIDKFLFLNKNHPAIENLPRTFQNVYGKKSSESLLFKVFENDLHHDATITKDQNFMKVKGLDPCYGISVVDAKRRRLCSPIETERKDVRTVENSTRKSQCTRYPTNSWKPTEHYSKGKCHTSISNYNFNSKTSCSLSGETNNKTQENDDHSEKTQSVIGNEYNTPHTMQNVHSNLESIETYPTSNTKLAMYKITKNLENNAKTQQSKTMKSDENNKKPVFSVNHEIIDLTDDLNTSSEAHKHIDSDLDHLILNTLKHLPSYISDNTRTTTSVHKTLVTAQDDHTGCFNCQDTKLLYRVVSCQHHICRVCLSSKKVDLCTICNVAFSSADVIRIFNS